MGLRISDLLPPELRARIALLSVEMERLYTLPDRWLGRELLRLARRVRDDFPDRFGAPFANAGEAVFLWDAVPEIAHRLGETALLPGERATLRGLSDGDLRLRVGYLMCWLPSDLGYPNGRAEFSPWDVLVHSIPNGNPVAMALDRLSPPDPSVRDPLAAQILEVSRARGFDPTPFWRPALQNWEARHPLPELPSPMAP